MAEDEHLVAFAVSDMLESEGHRVTVTHDGQQALAAAAQDAPQLLLTDMRMPVMTGHELIERIRQSHPALPILVMTGFSEHFPLEEPGRLRVLSKPFTSAQLTKAIQSLLNA